MWRKKYFALDRRVGLLLEKRLRARLVQYLRTELVPCADGARVCPFSRTRLAEYLGCDRTALAREITRMEARRRSARRGAGVLSERLSAGIFFCAEGLHLQALFAILWSEEIPIGGIGIKESDNMSLEHSSDVTRRLARIAGQINGIRDMVEDGRECEDILVQLSSASSARRRWRASL